MLDLGGVLWLPHRGRIQERLAAAGITATRDEIARAHYCGVSAEDRASGTFEETLPHYLDGLLDGVGANPTQAATGKRLLLENFRSQGAWSEPLSRSIEALPLLAATGIRLGIVTNADGFAEDALREMGICQVGPGKGVSVEVVIDSGAVGIRKPDPRIFELALHAMEVTAAEAAYVGDSVRKDVEGAASAGLRPIHFDPFDLCSSSTHQHVHELADLLR